MPNLYQLSRIGVRFLYKTRHHRGHGIHSPFVFSLINDVIEEKLPFYAFDDIQKYLIDSRNIVDEKIKTNKLLFRLVNRFNPSKVLEVGSKQGISTLYLIAPSKKIQCISVGADEKAKKNHEKWSSQIQYLDSLFDDHFGIQDFVLINLEGAEIEIMALEAFLLSNTHDKSVVVIEGIHKNRKNQHFWRSLIKNKKVIISLDLYELGILFFDRKYYKQNYKLSF